MRYAVSPVVVSTNKMLKNPLATEREEKLQEVFEKR
jgi:hypothetical protein